MGEVRKQKEEGESRPQKQIECVRRLIEIEPWSLRQARAITRYPFLASAMCVASYLNIYVSIDMDVCKRRNNQNR